MLIIIIVNNNLNSFCINAVSFSLTVEGITKKLLKILKKSNKLVEYNYNNTDKRNYNVGSKIFKKNFKNFKFSNLKEEISLIISGIKKRKLSPNIQTIRYDFYKKLLSFIKKKYNKNKIYNNQYSLKYHLNNADNKASLRLNKFFSKNVTIKKF